MIKKKHDLAMKADLHVHTSYSDGILDPRHVVENAVQMGLGAIAITDHDCIDGIPMAVKASKNECIEVVPGVELSAAVSDIEIHILGYFIDQNDPELVSTLERLKNNRIERARNILALLRSKGLDINEKYLFSQIKEGIIGRMHLARIMVESGFVANIYEAFDRYLGDGKPCSIRHIRLDYTEAVSIIKGAGGVAVLAHPGTMGRDEFIEDYVRAGITGIEACHIKHKPKDVKKYIDIADKLGLVVTAGSDCHGESPERLLMGKVTCDIEVVDILRKKALAVRGKNRKKSNER